MRLLPSPTNMHLARLVDQGPARTPASARPPGSAASRPPSAPAPRRCPAPCRRGWPAGRGRGGRRTARCRVSRPGVAVDGQRREAGAGEQLVELLLLGRDAGAEARCRGPARAGGGGRRRRRVGGTRGAPVMSSMPLPGQTSSGVLGVDAVGVGDARSRSPATSTVIAGLASRATIASSESPGWTTRMQAGLGWPGTGRDGRSSSPGSWSSRRRRRGRRGRRGRRRLGRRRGSVVAGSVAAPPALGRRRVGRRRGRGRRRRWSTAAPAVGRRSLSSVARSPVQAPSTAASAARPRPADRASPPSAHPEHGRPPARAAIPRHLRRRATFSCISSEFRREPQIRLWSSGEWTRSSTRTPRAPARRRRCSPAATGSSSRWDVVIGRAAAGNSFQPIVLSGLRGVGKTVLLLAFREHANEAGWPVELFEARPGGDLRAQVAEALPPMVRTVNQQLAQQGAGRADRAHRRQLRPRRPGLAVARRVPARARARGRRRRLRRPRDRPDRAARRPRRGRRRRRASAPRC